MVILCLDLFDKLDTIASGPAVGDRSTFADCIEICRRYQITDLLPSSIRERFIRGSRGEIPDTAKENDPIFSSVTNTPDKKSKPNMTGARP